MAAFLCYACHKNESCWIHHIEQDELSHSLSFTKVSLAFSCTLPKVACFQSFLLTHCVFCGNLSQQFNITYLLRVPARLPKEPEQVFNFLSLHNEPEPRPSRKGWSGLGCCVAIFYCQIQHRTLTTERPSAWDTRR